MAVHQQFEIEAYFEIKLVYSLLKLCSFCLTKIVILNRFFRY